MHAIVHRPSATRRVEHLFVDLCLAGSSMPDGTSAHRKRVYPVEPELRLLNLRDVWRHPLLHRRRLVARDHRQHVLGRLGCGLFGSFARDQENWGAVHGWKLHFRNVNVALVMKELGADTAAAQGATHRGRRQGVSSSASISDDSCSAATQPGGGAVWGCSPFAVGSTIG